MVNLCFMSSLSLQPRLNNRLPLRLGSAASLHGSFLLSSSKQQYSSASKLSTSSSSGTPNKALSPQTAQSTTSLGGTAVAKALGQASSTSFARALSPSPRQSVRLYTPSLKLVVDNLRNIESPGQLLAHLVNFLIRDASTLRIRQRDTCASYQHRWPVDPSYFHWKSGLMIKPLAAQHLKPFLPAAIPVQAGHLALPFRPVWPELRARPPTPPRALCTTEKWKPTFSRSKGSFAYATPSRGKISRVYGERSPRKIGQSRMRAACKQWKDLIESPEFADLH
ncbi:hypothetical protein SELMODRAFT_403543 [Selaginella moellendorffii]|uniref:Uncharacterized protein n=1 Tax=Selaginella moellendorffii TaxID=88036 RepID=D8QRR5_SELML|nr:hypothetical protein SELMODRAFT_403543 [Selaginella moellendorffii]